jgi:O-antigen/teichoic acid export membrane protein
MFPKPQIQTNAEVEKFFAAEHLKDDLKNRSIRGGMATLLSQTAAFILRTGSTIILARLLTPNDYGLIAMVTTITNFVMMLKDMGLSTATIQKAKINNFQISTLFWINVAFGFGLSLLVAVLSPAIAWFYGDPRLSKITLALAGVFLFTGLTVQHQALLRRQMYFGTLAVIETTSLVLGIVIAIVAAYYYGAGYWALVLMQLAIPAINAVGVWVACRWRPMWPSRRSGIRSMLNFGLNLIGFNIVNYFSRNLDNVLIGRYYGSGALGLYSRAYQLLMWPIDYIRVPLTLVAMPALSRIQNDPVRFKTYCSKLASITAFISMPLMVFVAVCSESVTRVLLGEKWLGAGILFRLMAITGFIQTCAGVRALVLVSIGRSGRYFIFGVLNSVVTVASIIIGLPWGAVGVAASYAIANYIFLFPSLWYCFHQTPMTTGSFVKAVYRPMLASLCMGAAIIPIYLSLANQPDIVVVGACFAIGLFAYFGILVLIPGGYRILREFFSYLSLLFQKQKKVALEFPKEGYY